MDQALLVLADYQQTSKSGMGERDVRINELEAKHRGLLYQMMDNVLSTCTTTVNEALFNFESPGEGTKSSPEFILTLIEKTQHCCTELGASYTRLVNGGDPKDAITAASALAHSVGQLLQHSKDVNILATEQEDGELIEKFLRDGATSALEFFQNLGSQQLNIIESARKPDHIINLSRTSHHHIGKVLPLLEKLVQSKIRGSLEADLGSVVAREMQNAAKAIEEATRRLGLLIAQRTELDVNSAILQSAYALTTAIANLIQCATASQLEIVQDGKASSTSAFYKKNNKWTDGLISAAQSVASATTYLVEIADGLVQGKNTWEQLVVAAQEVSVSTTQLVAASRVKAKLHSKTQDRLEAAAVAVREATKLLVKAAKDAAKVVAEHQAKTQVVSLSKHEAKVKEMEQQVKILELEKNLQTARYQLGEMRKQGYQAE